MSNHYQDMTVLYGYYGMLDDPMTLKNLKFRAQLLLEEAQELLDAIIENNPEEIVDALIDSEVISTGTIALLGVDGDKAWAEVLRANSSKERGIKPGRENSGGFDLKKPEGWKPPNHSNNLGVLNGFFQR